jgi:diketogulonate reductase-like aldo/keto reductase
MLRNSTFPDSLWHCFSPFVGAKPSGSASRRPGLSGQDVFEIPAVITIGKAHAKSPAQVASHPPTHHHHLITAPLCSPPHHCAHHLATAALHHRSTAAPHRRLTPPVLTAAQVALRWLVQQEITAVTAAHIPAYIAEDIDLFDFVLTDAEMATLAAI